MSDYIFNGSIITSWSTTTPNSGDLLGDEYEQLYENDNYLKAEIDKLGGCSKSTDPTMEDNSDNYFPTEKAIRAYVEQKVSDLLGGVEADFNTLNNIVNLLKTHTHNEGTTAAVKIPVGAPEGLSDGHIWIE